MYTGTEAARSPTRTVSKHAAPRRRRAVHRHLAGVGLGTAGPPATPRAGAGGPRPPPAGAGLVRAPCSNMDSFDITHLVSWLPVLLPPVRLPLCAPIASAAGDP